MDRLNLDITIWHKKRWLVSSLAPDCHVNATTRGAEGRLLGHSSVFGAWAIAVVERSPKKHPEGTSSRKEDGLLISSTPPEQFLLTRPKAKWRPPQTIGQTNSVRTLVLPGPAETQQKGIPGLQGLISQSFSESPFGHKMGRGPAQHNVPIWTFGAPRRNQLILHRDWTVCFSRSSFCYHRFLCRLLLALRGAGNANFVKIAREKLVSFSAEDALAPGQHSTSPEPPSASPDCGNFKKKMPSKIKNANNEIANSPPLAIKNVVTKTSSSGSGSGPSTPRGNKTLGWFLSETLMEKEATPAAPESEAGSNASEGEKKKSRRGGGKQRGKKIAVECILPKKNPTCVGADSYSTLSPEEKVPSGNKEQSKEDYWYYDPVSDGFYYEQNGSRGWRKRMPANATLSQRPLKPLDSAEKMATQTPQTQNTPVVSAQYFTPSIKYYDAVSDGYFYEMASVDGWKKRQPASSSQSSTSSSSAPVEREGSLPSHGNPMFEDSEDKSTLSLANIPPYLKNNYKNPMDMVVYQNNIEKPNSIASSSSFSDEPANYYWPKSSDEALSAPDPAKPFTLPLADDSDSESSSSSRLYNFNVDKFIEDMNFNTCGLDVDSLISDMSAMKTPCNEGPGLGKCSAPSVWSWGDTASLTVPCEVPSVLPGLSNDIRKIWASGV
ncbi:hypothetical protein QR680_005531 [Steinernema hermaphroditum]|uniref:Uncharacterized protein n=1 Tax=Steinernema hermaphroditum TaxID=289476 RepID=A0AA39LV13_9BILA|nr:hypothetical protein QR680_005531 [Steinernema hermaphroditum]